MTRSPEIAAKASASAAVMDERLRGRILDEDAGLILTHRILVTRLCNPLLDQPWGAVAFTRKDLHQALLGDTRVPALRCAVHGDPAERATVEPLTRASCQRCEFARVVAIASGLRSLDTPVDLDDAHRCARDLLALTPDPHPITVDVGLGGFWPPWLISDGNHRVAAATAVNWPWLVVSACGDWDRAVGLFVEGTSLVDLLEQGR